MKKFTENIYILEKLGQGGMGEVFKAKIVKPEQGFEKIVALKVLPEYTPKAEKKKEALLKEARIVANLNHPNINQVYDVGEAEGTPYVIMDLIEGYDLREIIKTAKEKGIQLSISNSIEIALTLLDALEYAHSLPSPIIHRDISPHNVMVTNQGTVKLLDFGLSKIQENTDQSKTEGYVGKYSYLPLEVIEGKTYKAENDIYAVGLILYELLTLEKVYGGNLELEIIQKIKEGHIESALVFNPKISKELDELLMKWINPKEAKRIKDILEIRRELLLVKKELVSTSSLKEEVACVFSVKGSFKETVIEKRKKAPRINKTMLLLMFTFVVFGLAFAIYYHSPQENRFFVIVNSNKKIEISPPAEAKTNPYKNAGDLLMSTCLYACHNMVTIYSVFLGENKDITDELIRKQSGKNTFETFSMVQNSFYEKYYRDYLRQRCEQYSFFVSTYNVANFLLMTTLPPSFGNQSSFKDIRQYLKDEIKKNNSLSEDLKITLATHLQKKMLDIIEKKNKLYFNTQQLSIPESTGYNLIKLPLGTYLKTLEDCRSWGETINLLLSNHNTEKLKNRKMIILPYGSQVKFLKEEKPLFKKSSSKEYFFELPELDDPIFKQGLCLVEYDGGILNTAVSWVPKF